MNGLSRAIAASAVLALAACSHGDAPPAGGGVTDTGIDACLPQPIEPAAPNIIPANLTKSVSMLIQQIMPPGQSGHFPSAASCPTQLGSCAVPGQSPETYGPHIDDQRLKYWRSEFKPGAFYDVTGKTPLTLNLTTPVTDAVKVYRDDYGVPVVHASTDYGVWYGAGYALAQDRLFLIDQAIRQGRGTSGETNGADFVGADVQARVLTYT
jgi:acyl-homoserine lactone acylase PvdQ